MPATLEPIKSETNVFTKRKRDTKAELKGVDKLELNGTKYLESKVKAK